MGSLFKVSGYNESDSPKYYIREEFDTDFSRYDIKKEFNTGGYSAVLIKYEDYGAYENHKILVCKPDFEGENIANLLIFKKLEKIDPHFHPDNPINLIARFIPTEQGWKMAVKLVKKLAKNN